MTHQTGNRKPKGKSALLGWLGKRIDRLSEALSQSALARFLCGYDRLRAGVNQSFFVGLIRRLSSALKKRLHKAPRREIGSEALGQNEVGIFVPSSLHKSLKTRLSEAVEESILIEKTRSILQLLFFIPMISYGVFLFAFGLFTTVIQAMLFFLQGQASEAALDLFTGLGLVLLSLPAMFKGYEPLIDCLHRSVSGSFLLRSIFGVQDMNRQNDRKTVGGANFLLFLAGMLCGAATWLIPPMRLILLGCALLFMVGVIFVPEAGLLLLLVSFPFLGGLPHTSIVCAAAVLYVGVCWLIKVALGKRSFSVDASDALVLSLMLLILISGFAGGSASMQSALLYLAMMFAYLLSANLLRSKLWIRRSSDGLIISSFAVALIGLVQWMRDETVSSVFSSPMILNCYLLLLLPLTLARLSASETRRGKFHYFIVIALQSACIFAGGSRLAVVIWLIELIGFCLLSSKKTWPILLALILLLPIVSCILPIFTDSVPDLSMPAWEAERETSLGMLELIGDAPLTGIGMSDSLLIRALSNGGRRVTPELGSTYLRLALQIGIPGLLLFLLLAVVWYVASFSLICGPDAGTREKCYTRGSIMGLTGMLGMGLFCYLWADYRLLMLFWCMAGVYQAVRKYSKEHESRRNDDQIPAQGVQWVNLDLYFDGEGKAKGSAYYTAESEKGGEPK